jgi:DNA primase
VIDPAVIDEVKRRTSIATVIQRFTELRPQGRRLVGLCPFHAEKSPSFSVNEVERFFYCFGCGAHGDVFEFLCKMRGLSFIEVLEDLAREAGVVIPQRSDNPDFRKERDHRKTLVAINNLVAEYFHKVFLQSSLAQHARDYLVNRHIESLAVSEFRIGYAPDDWSMLTEFLRKKGVDLEQAAELGLVRRREGAREFYDVFRNRLMFPIADERGDIIGFGGRTLGDDKAKYINSPETAVFKKGKTLYGLHQALPAVMREGYAIFVEGYIDLIALWQAGIKNVAAPLGTALTREHLDLAQRRASSVVFLFDGDAAGEKAAERAVELVLEVGLPARMVHLEENLDPDDFVNRYGADALRARVENAKPLVGYFLDRDWVATPKDAPGIANWVRKALDTVAKLRDPYEIGLYLKMIADRSSFNEAVLRKQIAGRVADRATTAKRSEPEAEPQGLARFPNEEVMVIKLLLHYPHLRGAFKQTRMIEKFSDPLLRRAAAILTEGESDPSAVQEVPDALYADEEISGHIRRWVQQGVDEAPEAAAAKIMTDALIFVAVRHLDDQVRALKFRVSQPTEAGQALAANGELARLRLLREQLLKEKTLESLALVN